MFNHFFFPCLTSVYVEISKFFWCLDICLRYPFIWGRVWGLLKFVTHKTVRKVLSSYIHTSTWYWRKNYLRMDQLGGICLGKVIGWKYIQLLYGFSLMFLKVKKWFQKCKICTNKYADTCKFWKLTGRQCRLEEVKTKNKHY